MADYNLNLPSDSSSYQYTPVDPMGGYAPASDSSGGTGLNFDLNSFFSGIFSALGPTLNGVGAIIGAQNGTYVPAVGSPQYQQYQQQQAAAQQAQKSSSMMWIIVAVIVIIMLLSAVYFFTRTSKAA